jgi:lysophospholipid acyltransferase (LPLAT)-like uncharacterized protein
LSPQSRTCYRAGVARGFPFLTRRLLQGEFIQRAAARLLGLYLDLALRSTRWTIEGRSHIAPYLGDGAVIVAFWHERLPLMPALWAEARRANPQRRAAVLASRHRDGRFIGSVLGRFGVRVVHGSTGTIKPGSERVRDRGGAAGLRALLTALEDGEAVVITPDGPRGPRRVAAPGAAQLGALSQAPVVPASGQIRHRITLRTWDRMVLPLPFGRGALVCLAPVFVPPNGVSTSLPGIEAALTQAADRADALCQP